MDRSLIIGVGNILYRDEGVGVHAVNYLSTRYVNNPNVHCMDGGTLGFILASNLKKNINLIIIDAMQLKAPAGSVRSFVGDEMDKYLQHSASSVHEIGIIDMLMMARLTDTIPVKRALVGIHPQSLEWGEKLTEEVKNSLSDVAQMTDRLLQGWGAINHSLDYIPDNDVCLENNKERVLL